MMSMLVSAHKWQRAPPGKADLRCSIEEYGRSWGWATEKSAKDVSVGLGIVCSEVASF